MLEAWHGDVHLGAEVMMTVCAILAVIGAFTVLVVALLMGLIGYFVWFDFVTDHFDGNRMHTFRVICHGYELEVKAASAHDALESAKQVWLSETFLTRQQLEAAVCLGSGPSKTEATSN